MVALERNKNNWKELGSEIAFKEKKDDSYLVRTVSPVHTNVRVLIGFV